MPETRSVGAVLEALGSRAPFAKAADWDPVGLSIGDPAAPAARVALCHEVTEAVVAAVEAEPVDLLVSYHPLLFRPTTRLVAGRGPAGRALRLARAGTALGVLHTNFDVAPSGAADALAGALGLERLQPFAPLQGPESLKIVTFLPAAAADAVVQAAAAAGAGVVGNYTHCSFRSEGQGSFYAGEGTRPTVGARGALNLEPEVRLEFVAPLAREAQVIAALVSAHPYEEPAYDVYPRHGDAGCLGRIGSLPAGTTLRDVAERVRGALRPALLRLAGSGAAPADRLALVPGSGADLIEAAAETGAQVLVTGDVSHHRARAALDLGLGVVDPGHAATERPGLERLLTWLREISPGCRSLLELDPDPWTDAGA